MRLSRSRGGSGDMRPGMLLIMSTAREWDFTVPDNEAELLAELRRHGVQPGQRLHVAVAAEELDETGANEAPAFFGAFSGPRDLAERADDILRAEFPHGL